MARFFGPDGSAVFEGAQLDTFLAEHWGRTLLHRKADPQKPLDLFNFEAFRKRMTPAAHPVARFFEDLFRRNAHGQKGNTVYAGPDGRGEIELGLQPDNALALVDEGRTACFLDLERRFRDASRFLDAFRAPLRTDAVGMLKLYVSPDGRGFGWHFDCEHVFVFQIEGTKRWHLSRAPAHPSPPFNIDSHLFAKKSEPRIQSMKGLLPPPSDAELVEVMLEPGDVLYLPPGTWHRTAAQGFSASVSLTLYPLPWARLMRHTISEHSHRHSSWRDPLPSGAEAHDRLSRGLAEAQKLFESLRVEHLYPASSVFFPEEVPEGSFAHLLSLVMVARGLDDHRWREDLFVVAATRTSPGEPPAITRFVTDRLAETRALSAQLTPQNLRQSIDRLLGEQVLIEAVRSPEMRL